MKKPYLINIEIYTVEWGILPYIYIWFSPFKEWWKYIRKN